MRRHTIAVTVAFVCVLAAFGPAAYGQDPGMDAMMKMAAPGEQHKQLEMFAGSWTTEMKAWMAPGQEPVTSHGSAEIKSILGGRYLQEDFSAEFMGMPFAGTGLTGYDNVRKQYFSTWADNMGTSVMLMTGSYDPAKKTYSYEGSYADPMSGKDKTMRIAIVAADANKHVSEFYDQLPDGKWVKIMEITYTRK